MDRRVDVCVCLCICVCGGSVSVRVCVWMGKHLKAGFEDECVRLNCWQDCVGWKDARAGWEEVVVVQSSILRLD